MNMSASPVGNYYLYSFDGKLLQMYDVYGTCLKDYIYMGDRLIAEYDHVGSRYLYYTPDQINSTRVVTDDSGTVVYSAAHDTYGGIQQTWVNTFDPLPKFSGKERDAESGLDYFGARYYDRAQYRFVSVDPLFPRNPSLDSQLMNAYSFSRGNPISYFDSDGRFPVTITVIRNGYTSEFGIIGTFSLVTPGGVLTGATLERPFLGVVLAQTSGSMSAVMPGTYGAYIAPDYAFQGGVMADTIVLTGTNLGSRTGICFHNGGLIKDSRGCILVGSQRQAMYDLIANEMNLRAYAAMGMPGGILLMLECFNSLPSVSWFPEINVDIRNGAGMFFTTPLPNDSFIV